MPSLPATPSPVIRVVLGHVVDEDPLISTGFCMSYSGGPPTTANLTDLATAIAGDWATALASELTVDGYLAKVTCFDLANPATVEGVYELTQEGLRTGAMVSISTCAVIDLAIDRRYRGSRPKLFTPYGVVADSEDANQWLAAFIDELTTDWGDFLTYVGEEVAGSTHLLNPVGVSYYHGFTVVTNPLTGRARNVPTLRDTPVVSAVTSWLTRPRFGTQRRRITAG